MPLLDFDFLVGDELRGADVDVVAAASAEVFHHETGAVGAAVEGESGGCEPLEEGTVSLHDSVGGLYVEVFEDGVGDGHGEYVCVFDRGLIWNNSLVGVHLKLEGGTIYPIFVVKTFHGHVNQTLACDDEGAAALHNCDIVAMVMVISGDVVAGIATADYDCFFALGVLSGLGELR